MFFAKQCSVIDSDSKVPSFLHLKPDKSLSNITFTEKDANLQIMQILDSDKAHEHDTISIRMLNPLMLGGNKKVTHT